MISPGVLNRVRASTKYDDFPELNVSASYLAKQGIEISFQGNITDFLPAMTGAVQSPQPYLLSQVKLHILRSQSLASQYKARWELDSKVGNVRLYTDSSVFGEFDLSDAAITSVADMTFAGGDPGVAITLTGTYYVNSSMWDF
ncbi:hypothetical protein [Buttiauxella sp. S19-1]|uniref:hypothetical protein n=1 Tax=Buttiauxella sp. S19-1 TaxID=941430 RepID=UPI001EDA7289|nr:hypothetical protein [Buttiauxella sp. S19-1]